MTQVSRNVELPVSAEILWSRIGSFQGFANWHPAVQGCAREDKDGAEFRRLDLGEGVEILEKSLGDGEMSYSYAIIEPGPLPVAGYRSTLSVAPTSAGCAIVWSATFDAVGPEADAVAAIAGVYDAGLSALQVQFSV